MLSLLKKLFNRPPVLRLEQDGVYVIQTDLKEKSEEIFRLTQHINKALQDHELADSVTVIVLPGNIRFNEIPDHSLQRMGLRRIH